MSRSTGCACSVTGTPRDDFGATTLSLATTARPCNYPDDRSRLVDLWLACRIATSVDLYPTIWRLCLLLTSRVWDPALDTRIWEDAAGRMIGFAMLWRRRREDAYLVLERFVHPASVTGEMAHTSLVWGTERARAIAAELAMPLTLFTSVLHPDLCPDDRPESCGYVQTTPDPQQYNVYFARSLREELPIVTLPAGYTIRHLGDLDELEAYQDLYDFSAVSPHHLRELLGSDEYGHLVAVDAGGQGETFQAYCEVSICRAEWRLGGGRIGWIDYVGTRPEKQRRGLGRAILLAGLHDLSAWGAESARLVTVSTNSPAIQLYHATGFHRVEAAELPVYEMLIPYTRISPALHPASDRSPTLGMTDSSLQTIVADLTQGRIAPGLRKLQTLKDEFYAAIPAHQRQSRGITWVLQRISQLLAAECRSPQEMRTIVDLLYGTIAPDDRLMGVPIFLMAEYGKTDPSGVLEFFTQVADSSDWVVREFAAAGFHKLIKPCHQVALAWLKTAAQSDNPNLRRFASETLRPVTDNRWLNDEPESSLEILRLLFREAHPYPRTSVGNNLSDLARRNPDLILAVVKQLVEIGDENSYWIAYRACRNLVKQNPERVMDLLGVDEYHYKDRHFYRKRGK